MKKVYLTERISETTGSKNYPADIRQKLEAYNTDKVESFNEAPQIRPYPLEKYDTQKTKETIDAAEATPSDSGLVTTRFDNTKALSAIQKLPKYLQSRGKKLMPYLLQTNYPEDEDLHNLLYDLLNKNSKKLRTRNPELIQSIIAQLNDNELVPKNLYIQNLGGSTQSKPPTLSHSPYPSQAPTRRTSPAPRASYVRSSAATRHAKWD